MADMRGDSADSAGSGNKDTVARDIEICGHCKTRCTDKGKGSDGLLCDHCQCWVHAKCEGMSVDSYKMFSQLANNVPNMKYTCSANNCQIVSEEFMKKLGPINSKVADNTRRIEVLEVSVKDQNKVMEDKITDVVTNCVDDKIEQQVKSAWELEKERFYRSRNVLIANVKEPETRVSNERKSQDIEFVDKLFTEQLGLGAVIMEKVKNVVRLGGWRDEVQNGKPRLIKVVFERDEEAKAVFRQANKISESTDEEIRKLKIFRDMCLQDREKRKILVDDMKAKNEELVQQGEMDNKWIIRGEKLVNIKIRSNPQRQQTF